MIPRTPVDHSKGAKRDTIPAENDPMTAPSGKHEQ